MEKNREKCLFTTYVMLSYAFHLFIQRVLVTFQRIFSFHFSSDAFLHIFVFHFSTLHVSSLIMSTFFFGLHRIVYFFPFYYFIQINTKRNSDFSVVTSCLFLKVIRMTEKVWQMFRNRARPTINKSNSKEQRNDQSSR